MEKPFETFKCWAGLNALMLLQNERLALLYSSLSGSIDLLFIINQLKQLCAMWADASCAKCITWKKNIMQNLLFRSSSDVLVSKWSWVWNYTNLNIMFVLLRLQKKCTWLWHEHQLHEAALRNEHCLSSRYHRWNRRASHSVKTEKPCGLQ